ncbi:DUF2079 domain-containing protein [Streptomyces broussonetiae]|uniref:DUF2079 domain-containing protein n=1 Tax=Streptomyces broussonetiae TaxID=2686304 RepID=UPI0035DBB5C3
MGRPGDPACWGTGYHYSAVLMPVVFAAFVDALSRPGPARHAPAASVALPALLLPQYPLWQLTQPATWRTEARLTTARRLMDRIPDGATIAASNRLVPQLTDRTEVSVFALPGSRPDPQWIIDDTGQPQSRPIPADQERRLLAEVRNNGYRTAADDDGYVLLQRLPRDARGGAGCAGCTAAWGRGQCTSRSITPVRSSSPPPSARRRRINSK